MSETPKTPKNSRHQPPSRTPQETAERLREKERDQVGRANRRRTEERIREVERW